MSADVRINGDVHSLASADSQWVAQSINDRKHDGVPVNVTVTISEPGIDLVLTAPPRSGGGGGRVLTTREREIVEMWTKHHLDDAVTKVGEVVSFLNDLRRYL